MFWDANEYSLYSTLIIFGPNCALKLLYLNDVDIHLGTHNIVH